MQYLYNDSVSEEPASTKNMFQILQIIQILSKHALT